MILYRIAKILLRRGYGKDLVQVSLLHTMGRKGKPTDEGFILVVWGAYFNI